MKAHGNTRRPSIGLTPDLGATASEPPQPRYELKTPYSEAIFRAGGLPLVVPYSTDRACIDAYLERLQGLVVTGGAFDVPAHLYGETPREGMGPTKPERTEFEALLIRGALSRNLPVLGICGGMQLLNVVHGGTLYQDIALEVPNARSHQQDHDRTQPHHPVDVKDGTQLALVLGKGHLMVNSTHHQAVKTLGDKLVAAAVALDGVIEAIESTVHPFAIGVQWHPELLFDVIPAHQGVFRALIQKARDLRR